VVVNWLRVLGAASTGPVRWGTYQSPGPKRLGASDPSASLLKSKIILPTTIHHLPFTLRGKVCGTSRLLHLL
jgi:hypothetical protein